MRIAVRSLRPRITVLMTLACTASQVAAGAPATATGGGMEAEFDGSFLVGGARAIDVDRYRYGNPVSAGEFLVDILMNGSRVMRDTVTFADPHNTGVAQPCMSATLLGKLGVRLPVAASAEESCIELSRVDADARATFDPAEQALFLSVPQVAMLRQPREYVDRSQWDAGIDAVRLSYNLSVFDSSGDTYSFLGLNMGANIGDWRLRHSLTGSHAQGESAWRSLSAHAQRDIPRLNAQLTVGDSFTSGELFDSMGFRGARLATDDRMLPQSMRGYAPVVRGSARTSARVQIHQNGSLIYETSVAAGRFVIDDLYPTGYGGDLVVTVTEADGSLQTFSVPYASVAQLLRPGYGRFSVTAGQLRSTGLSDPVNVGEATWQRGISNSLTAYAGTQASDSGYQAAMGGVAVNTPVGAVAIDTTYSQSKADAGRGDDARFRGTSSRITYSNVLAGTGTNFSLAAYRYSTSGYRSLTETAHLNERLTRDDSSSGLPQARNKGRLQLSLNQDLGDWGALHVSGSAQDYWNRSGTDLQYTAGFSRRVGRSSVALSASRVRMGDGSWDNQSGLSVSVPLGGGSMRSRAPVLSLSVDDSGSGRDSVRSAISGTAGERGQASYSASATRSGSRDEYALGGTYSTGIGTFGGMYSRGSNARSSASLNASGALVAFRDGVVLAPQLGETIAVVEARGAAGSKLESGTNITIGRNGLAVAPYLVPYQYNPIGLDPTGGSLDFELRSTNVRVAPTAGAVVKARFDVESGRALIVSGRQSNGQPLPFGADAFEGGKQIGVVGQGSRLLGRVSADSGTLLIQWGQGQGQQCSLDYQLEAADRRAATPIIEATCFPDQDEA